MFCNQNVEPVASTHLKHIKNPKGLKLNTQSLHYNSIVRAEPKLILNPDVRGRKICISVHVCVFVVSVFEAFIIKQLIYS